MGKETICFHCGDRLPDTGAVEHDDKLFCCNGCQTVYALIHENGLEDFYNLPEKAQVKADAAGQYEYLDNDEIAEKFIRFKDDSITKVILNLPAIHCSSCIWLLEKLDKINPGIIDVQVNFVKKTAEITFKHKIIPLKKLAYLLQSIGYPPTFSLEKSEVKKQNNAAFFIRLGIAGFCFGNIMLFSIPEYLGIEKEYDEYARFFSYLNLGLAIPVLLFSARGYLVSAYKALKHRSVNIDVPISLGIIALFGRSAYEILTATGAGYMDSFAGLIFFLLIGKWYQQKTYDALSFERDYKSYFPIGVTKVAKDGSENHIPLEKVTIGDTLLIRNLELIPADALLTKGKATIDYSFVTGESTPVSIQTGQKIYAGGRQSGETIEVTLTESVEHSYLTSLWNNKAFKGKEETFTRKAFNQISKYFTIAVILIALATGIYWYFSDETLVWKTITAVLIIACPCALALTLPFTYGNALRFMGKRQLYMKNGDDSETFSQVTDIVFDKTGTLTEQGKSKITYHGSSLTTQQKQWIKSMVRTSTHPLSRQLEKHLSSVEVLPPDKIMEFPGKGLEAEIEGNTIRLGSATWLGVETADTVHSEVHIEINREIQGKFTFENYYRTGISELIQRLDYNLHLLSGDNDSERKTLETLFGKAENIRFEQSPQDKLDYITALQRKGKTVLYIGDGLNDAGALKAADFGIALAEDIHNFSPACDAILKAQNIHYLDRFLGYAQKTNTIIRASILLSFLYNVVGLSFAVSGQLTPLIAAILMPLSSVTVVVLITIMSRYYEQKTFA